LRHQISKMKNKSLLFTVVISLFYATRFLNAQCAVAVNLGSSSNMLTIIRNNANPVAVNNELNTVVFVHRNNHNQFGGHSGNLRYDISTNGGSTWSTNQGVLNPSSSSSLARYPNAVIHNPSGNTNMANAYIGYLAATTSGSFWNGVVTGARNLTGTSNTESYNQPAAPSYLIAGSLVKGAPGVFWAVDHSSDGTNYTGNINIYRGVWNGSNDISWSTNTILTPGFNTSYNGDPIIGEVNIAFDPTGNYGWISMTTHLNTGPSSYNLYPVFYKTTNGGATWSGPITVNLNQLSCITSNISQGNVAAAGFQSDLAVDAYGNPHLFTMVANGLGSYTYEYYQWHHMMDITQKNGIWTAYDIANVEGSPEDFIGSVSTAYQQTQPQVSRSADGKKIFFGWTDNTIIYNTGDPNTWPDFYARGFDVAQNLWTPIRDFTSCNFNTSGAIYFPHAAEDVLEPSTGVYKMAVVYARFTNGDPDQVANMRFLDNVAFSSSDFNISQPSLSLNLTPSGNIILCSGNTINLSISGNFGQVLWSNGGNQNSNNINVPGTFYVSARTGCLIGADSVVVKPLTIQPVKTSGIACEGAAVTLSVSGNSNGFTWMPGNISATGVTVFPTANTVYTVTGKGYNNCTGTNTVAVTVNAAPTIFAVTNKQSICSGEQVIMQASGADLYVWSTGATTSTIVEFPVSTTSYTVTGSNSNGCSKSFTLTQSVNACLDLEETVNTSGIRVYPNPSNGELTVFGGNAGDLKLYNVLGSHVGDYALDSSNGFTVQIHGLSPGIYFLVQRSGKDVVTHKIVVE
jgi:hypothetical protein